MTPDSMTEIWVYLSAQPLLWLTLTLAILNGRPGFTHFKDTPCNRF